MKLLTKSSLIILTASIFIFMLGGIFFYAQVKKLIEEDLNQKLAFKLTQTGKNLEKNIQHIHYYNFINEDIEIIPSSKIAYPYHAFKDTFLYDSLKLSYRPYRVITGYRTLSNNQTYKINIYESLITSQLLIERITIGFTLLSLLFILSIYFINKLLFERIWNDFFKTIRKIEAFDITGKNMPVLKESDVYEFSKLNAALNKMISRISFDYITLKEYTENISHEIQTPLAVIKTKIELLLQNENLPENQVELIKHIHANANRLSRLNKSLTLLTKIENNQYHNKERVSINEMIDSIINMFSDVIDTKNIRLNVKCADNIYKELNPSVTEIMFSNLVKNAVKYCPEHGEISIELNDNYFSISNTGEKLPIPENEIFNRFTAGSNNNKSLGLGLAIVKSIANMYNFTINYLYEEKHIFLVRFKQNI